MPTAEAEDDDVLIIRCQTEPFVDAKVGGDARKLHRLRKGIAMATTATEAFGPVLVIVEIGSGGTEGAAAGKLDVGTYLEQAVEWANSEDVCGSLSCSILAPASASPATVEACAAGLNFGTVAINTWSVFGYTCMALGATWGAHPSDARLRSGRGRLGNAFAVPDVVKTVVRGSPLATPKLDLSSPPPTVVFDLLHQLATLSTGYGAGFVRFLVFVLLRTLQLLYIGFTGRRYGAAI